MLKPEQIMQMQLFDWIRSKPELEPYAWHCPNERKATPQHGRILKRLGVRSGVSDIFICIGRGGKFGMFLELKAANNTPSKNQLRFMSDMSLQNYHCAWSKSFDEAKKAIEEYLSLETPSCK